MDWSAMQYLLGENEQDIRFMQLDADKVRASGYRDPWGALYHVQFNQNPYLGRDSYETTIQFPNRLRYLYD